MRDKKDDFANEIRLFLEKNGIDPFLALNILAFIVLLSYRKDIQRWNEIEDWRKGLIGSTAFAAAVFSLINLLRLVNIIKY